LLGQTSYFINTNLAYSVFGAVVIKLSPGTFFSKKCPAFLGIFLDYTTKTRNCGIIEKEELIAWWS
jgi:hypothetical protein